MIAGWDAVVADDLPALLARARQAGARGRWSDGSVVLDVRRGRFLGRLGPGGRLLSVDAARELVQVPVVTFTDEDRAAALELASGARVLGHRHPEAQLGFAVRRVLAPLLPGSAATLSRVERLVFVDAVLEPRAARAAVDRLVVDMLFSAGVRAWTDELRARAVRVAHAGAAVLAEARTVRLAA